MLFIGKFLLKIVIILRFLVIYVGNFWNWMFYRFIIVVCVFKGILIVFWGINSGKCYRDMYGLVIKIFFIFIRFLIGWIKILFFKNKEIGILMREEALFLFFVCVFFGLNIICIIGKLSLLGYLYFFGYIYLDLLCLKIGKWKCSYGVCKI